MLSPRQEDRSVDFIFIIGAPAVGKTTLARELYKRLGGVYIEQNSAPEFMIPAYVKDEGAYEEQVCWGYVLRQAEYFRSLCLHNIIILDFDDIRIREVPLIFKGQSFAILRLYSSDPEQIKVQMIHRAKNEGGLYYPEMALRITALHRRRPLLPNEIKLDVAGKTPSEVLDGAETLLKDFSPLTDYEYALPDDKDYYSWVISRGLRQS